jgi:4-amino-4-deoxy-L-arabinose transferase-like glycosyltransferase
MSDRITHEEAAPWQQWLKRHRSLLLVGLAILFVLVVRVRLREMPLERDEGEYAYAGQLMLQGVPPYMEVYNMKLPGTYAAYAVIMALLGQTPSGIHLGVMVVNVASILLVFLVGRRLLDEITGVVAAVCFALMSLSPSILGLAGHATHFVVLFALGGMMALVWNLEVRGVKSKAANPRVAMLASGLLFGLAFLMKQQGIFFGIFGLVYLLWLYIDDRRAEGEARRLSRAGGQAGRGRDGRGQAGAHEQQLSGSFVKSRVTRPAGLGTGTAAGVAPRLNAIQAKRLQAEQEKPEGRGGVGEAEMSRDGDSDSQKTAAALQTQSRKESVGLASQPANGSEANRTGLPTSAVAVMDPQHVGPNAGASVGSTFVAGTPAARRSAIGAFVAGLVAPYLLTCVILLCMGAFHQFIFWTITYAGKYASAIPLAFGPEMLRAGLRTIVGPNILFWVLPWAGALMMWWDERTQGRDGTVPKAEGGREVSRPRTQVSRARDPRLFVIALLLCSAGSVSIGLYFREHYFIQLLPALALLSGLAVSRALHLLWHDKSIELFLALPVLAIFILAVGSALIGNGALWLVMPASEAAQSIYGTSLFAEASKAAKFLKTNAPAQARIAVLGSEPEIYFESHRRSVSGYIYIYPLLETHSYAAKMQQELMDKIEATRPDYVVFVDDYVSWLTQPESDQKIFGWWKTYSSQNLELVMTYDLEEPVAVNPEGKTSKRFGDEESTVGSDSAKNHLFVFRRKQGEPGKGASKEG